MPIRRAKVEEADILTEISFQSKGYWDYPPEYFDIWKDELTVTEKYIRENTVFVYEQDDELLGYYALVYNPRDRHMGTIFIDRGLWLEHLFVVPERIKTGIGTALIDHALQICQNKGIRNLKIFADPYSSGFYERRGAQKIREADSTIPGRTIPVYQIEKDKIPPLW